MITCYTIIQILILTDKLTNQLSILPVPLIVFFNLSLIRYTQYLFCLFSRCQLMQNITHPIKPMLCFNIRFFAPYSKKFILISLLQENS